LFPIRKKRSRENVSDALRGAGLERGLFSPDGRKGKKREAGKAREGAERRKR